MKKLNIEIDPRVAVVFDKYPDHILPKVIHLRNLILETAGESPSLDQLSETIKWGEPSYIAPKGSTIRIDWKSKKPEQYAIYFKCTSKLVISFKEVFGDTFNYEGNRAIVFKLDDAVPTVELKKCILAALQYHQVKDQPLLGIEN